MVEEFASELLRARATVEAVDHVALHSEGPIVNGRAYLTLGADQFLEFYFNEKTGTMAFALIEGQRRIWGIDRDNIRGWHLHPLENPAEQVEIKTLSVSRIIARLGVVLQELGD